MDVSDAAVERVSREFPEADRREAERLILQSLADEPRSAVPTWETVLDLARGDLATLRPMVGSDADCSDFRDRWIGRDRWRILAQLVSPRGDDPIAYGCLNPEYAAEIQRLIAPHRERAAQFFPPEQVDEALLRMGWSWPSNADEILALEHGDVRRLSALFRACRAGEFDPSTPPVLADLPLAPAELIRRDFSPQDWETAARVAAGAPPMRGEGGVLAWLLAAEYARGNVADFSWAVRMLRENESELYTGVGRRRAERRAAGLE